MEMQVTVIPREGLRMAHRSQTRFLLFTIALVLPCKVEISSFFSYDHN